MTDTLTEQLLKDQEVVDTSNIPPTEDQTENKESGSPYVNSDKPSVVPVVVESMDIQQQNGQTEGKEIKPNQSNVPNETTEMSSLRTKITNAIGREGFEEMIKSKRPEIGFLIRRDILKTTIKHHVGDVRFKEQVAVERHGASVSSKEAKINALLYDGYEIMNPDAQTELRGEQTKLEDAQTELKNSASDRKIIWDYTKTWFSKHKIMWLILLVVFIIAIIAVGCCYLIPNKTDGATAAVHISMGISVVALLGWLLYPFMNMALTDDRISKYCTYGYIENDKEIRKHISPNKYTGARHMIKTLGIGVKTGSKKAWNATKEGTKQLVNKFKNRGNEKGGYEKINDSVKKPEDGAVNIE